MSKLPILQLGHFKYFGKFSKTASLVLNPNTATAKIKRTFLFAKCFVHQEQRRAGFRERKPSALFIMLLYPRAAISLLDHKASVPGKKSLFSTFNCSLPTHYILSKEQI